MKKISLLVLLFTAVMGLTGCSDADRTGLFDYTALSYEQSVTVPEGLLVTEGVLTVATSPDYAPYSFLDLELSGLSRVQGAESAIAYYVAQVLGLELVFVEASFSSLTTELDQNRADVIFSGLTYEESREEYYQFTDSYYSTGDGGQVLLTLEENLDLYNSYDLLNASSVTIGAQQSSLQATLVGAQLADAVLSEFTAITDGVLQLQTGKIDVMASSYTSAETLVETYTDLVIIDGFAFEVDEQGTMGLVSQGNELVTYINEAIAMFEDETYAEWLELFQEYADAIAYVNE